MSVKNKRFKVIDFISMFDFLHNYKIFIDDIYYKARYLIKTNYDLCLFHYYNGNIFDAKYRARFILFLNKRWNIGRTYSNNIRFLLARIYYDQCQIVASKKLLHSILFRLDRRNMLNVLNILYDGYNQKYCSHLHLSTYQCSSIIMDEAKIFIKNIDKPTFVVNFIHSKQYNYCENILDSSAIELLIYLGRKINNPHLIDRVLLDIIKEKQHYLIGKHQKLIRKNFQQLRKSEDIAIFVNSTMLEEIDKYLKIFCKDLPSQINALHLSCEIGILGHSIKMASKEKIICIGTYYSDLSLKSANAQMTEDSQPIYDCLLEADNNIINTISIHNRSSIDKLPLKYNLIVALRCWNYNRDLPSQIKIIKEISKGMIAISLYTIRFIEEVTRSRSDGVNGWGLYQDKNYIFDGHEDIFYFSEEYINHSISINNLTIIHQSISNVPHMISSAKDFILKEMLIVMQCDQYDVCDETTE